MLDWYTVCLLVTWINSVGNTSYTTASNANTPGSTHHILEDLDLALVSLV